MPFQRRFSHSLVQTALQCPRKAYYRYIEKVETPIPVPFVKGNAADAAFNLNLQQKITSGGDLTRQELLSEAERAWKESIDNAGGASGVEWRGEHPEDAKNSTMRMVAVWLKELAPRLKPEKVQVPYTKKLRSGREFIGYLDFMGFVDDLYCIGDNKTGKRRMSDREVPMALQPFAYSWLTGIRDFVFLRAIDTGKNSYTEIVSTTRSAGDDEMYVELAEGVEKHFEEGHWPRNPTTQWCGNSCEFYERCMPHRTVSGGA